MASKKGGTSVVSGNNLNIKTLRAVVEILEASEVTHLQWKSGGEELYIMRGHPPMTPPMHSGAGVHVMTPHPAPAAPSTEARPRPSIATASKAPAASPGGDAPREEKKGTLVTSPFVGTFYR